MEKLLPEDVGGNPNTTTYSFGDWMDLLALEHGDRWVRYRESYKRTNFPDSALEESRKLSGPITITLELVNRCNLKCVMCWTDNHSLERECLSLKILRRS